MGALLRVRSWCLLAMLAVCGGCVAGAREDAKDYNEGYRAGVQAVQEHVEGMNASLSIALAADLGDMSRYPSHYDRSEGFRRGFADGVRDEAARLRRQM